MEVDRTDLTVFGGLLLVALFAYIYFANPLGPSTPATVSPLAAQASSTPSPTVAVAEILQPCLDSATPDACAGTAAYDAGRLSDCQSWPQADACRFFYYAQRAEREKDSLTLQQGMQACLSINNTAIRGSCLQEYAIRTGDPAYCQALEYGRFRQACLDEVSRR